mgnify:CR=1 FL=1
MFSMSVWVVLFVLSLAVFVISATLLVGAFLLDDPPLDKLFFLCRISFPMWIGCIVVLCVGVFSAKVFYSNYNVNYEKVNTIKSIKQLDENSLSIFTTDSNNIVQVKEYTLDLNANTDVTGSGFDVCDGDAVLSDSDKKVVEKVTVTGTENINYHCPLIKNSTKEKTTTYYIVYYPMNELNVNK